MKAPAWRADTVPGPSPTVHSAALGAFGFVLFAAVWEVIGRTEALGPAWPPFSQVIGTLFDRRSTLSSALLVTSREAAVGYVIGAGSAFLSGVASVFVRPIRSGLLHLAVVVNAIPVIALGPVLISILPREWTPIALASLAVYFTTLVATTTGFAATRPAHEDLFTVLGAEPRERFRRLQLPTAIPVIMDGLKLAVPAGVLGSILGEWFGSPRGVGPILVATMQDAIYKLLWATALTGVGLSLAGFGLLSLVRRRVGKRYE